MCLTLCYNCNICFYTTSNVFICVSHRMDIENIFQNFIIAIIKVWAIVSGYWNVK